MTSPCRRLVLAVLVVAGVTLPECASRVAAPFVAYFLAAGAWTIALGFLCRREALRNVALLCSSVLCSLAMVEICFYYASRSEIIITKVTPEGWRRRMTDIGSLPLPNTSIRFREFLDGRPLDDVTYKIDVHGLREIPDAVQGRPYKAAFFGGSFMFGHGVENNQTLPYYFVQNSSRTFAGFNFAGEGWGPHQMLREIETGFVRRVAGVPELAIYEAIPDHLRRVAGRAPWEDGPKYELCGNDAACFSGPFHSEAYGIWHRWLDESWIVRFSESRFAQLSRPSDIPLYLAVLKRTRSLLAEDGTRFVVVMWDQNELAKLMMKTLRENQFDVIALSSIVSENEPARHPLVQPDRHPSPATNRAIASYLWKQFGRQLVYSERPR